MKLSKFLLLGLLGGCLTIYTTGCDKEKDDLPPHPTSSFDECPLLAHGAPKLKIKKITLEQTVYRDGEVISTDKDVLSYNRKQRLVKEKAIWPSFHYSSDYERNYEYDAKGRLLKCTTDYKDRGEEAIDEYFYDEYGFLVSYKSKHSEEEYRYMDDTVFVTVKYSYGTVENYYSVYSKDMYPIYSASDDGAEAYYVWRNGNIVSLKSIDAKGNETYEEYKYDDKENIDRLMSSGIPLSVASRCENNQLDERTSYTYTKKGMVETETRIYSEYNEKIVRTYTYLYY